LSPPPAIHHPNAPVTLSDNLLTPSFLLFFLMTRPPPRSPLFPYTTLFRSERGEARLRWVRRSVDSQSRRPQYGAWSDRRRRPSSSEEHTSELQSLTNLVCRLLLVKKKNGPDIAPAIPSSSQEARFSALSNT